MRVPFAVTFVIAAFAIGTVVFGAEGSTSPYTDAVGDIDGGIITGNGTLDILGMEITTVGSDLNFKLTVNGNVSTTDWGKFMIGIGSYNAPLGTTTGNGWNRPINLQYTPNGFLTPAGMDYWIGSWVDGGGGSQLWTWDGSAWTGPASLSSYSVTPGATSDINYTVALSALGLAPGDQFTFDAYSSGGGSGDTAIDALANPNVAVTSWGQTYTSKPVTFGGGGLNSYTVPVPEPTTLAGFGLVGAAVAGRMIRRRSPQA
ncbi:MAG: PEP-CTERM sorting domain-containing protein [Planctomycetaceae bacterium]